MMTTLNLNRIMTKLIKATLRTDHQSLNPLRLGELAVASLDLLLKRNHGGKEFDELLMNTSVVDFMDSKESVAAFATFMAKVSTGCQC
jgi:hypothetical protein